MPIMAMSVDGDFMEDLRLCKLRCIGAARRAVVTGGYPGPVTDAIEEARAPPRASSSMNHDRPTMLRIGSQPLDSKIERSSFFESSPG